MKTVLQGAGVAAFAAFAYLCLTLSVAARSVTKHANQTLMASGDTLRKLDLDLDEIHRLTLEAALTAMEARKASAKEERALDQWNAQVAEVMTRASSALLSIQKAGDQVAASDETLTESAAKSLAQVSPVLQSATVELTDLHVATQHLDSLLADPALSATLLATAHTAAHLDATSKDVQDAVHSYFHPTWAQRILNWVKDGVVTVGQMVL